MLGGTISRPKSVSQLLVPKSGEQHVRTGRQQWILKNSTGPSFPQQAGLSSHSRALAASLVGITSRAVAGVGQMWVTPCVQEAAPFCSQSAAGALHVLLRAGPG